MAISAADLPPDTTSAVSDRRRRPTVAIYRHCDPMTSNVRRVYDFWRRGLQESTGRSSVLRVSAETKHLREVVQKLALLDHNWDGNNSPAPASVAIVNATSFIRALEFQLTHDFGGI